VRVFPNLLVFDSSSWNESQVVELEGAGPGPPEQTVVGRLTHSVWSDSDPAFRVEEATPATGRRTLSVVRAAASEPAIVLDAERISLREGEAMTYHVRLNKKPLTDVWVAASTPDGRCVVAAPNDHHIVPTAFCSGDADCEGASGRGAPAPFTYCMRNTNVVLKPQELLFTTSNWSRWGSVQMTAIADDVDDGNAFNLTVRHTSRSGATRFSNLSHSLSYSVFDVQAAGLMLSGSWGGSPSPQPPAPGQAFWTLVAKEGSVAPYTLSLLSRPLATVNVSLSVSTFDEHGASVVGAVDVSPKWVQVTAADWRNSFAVRITPRDDSKSSGPLSVRVTHTLITICRAVATLELRVTVADNDMSVAIVEDVDGAPLVVPLNVSEHGPAGLGDGTRAVYALRLRAAPLSGEALAVVVRPQTGICIVSVAGEASAEVPVNGTFCSVDRDCAGSQRCLAATKAWASPAEVAFTATTWNQPQLVTVGAYQDSFAEGQHTGRIVHELVVHREQGRQPHLVGLRR
jgi:hypothetical protein